MNPFRFDSATANLDAMTDRYMRPQLEALKRYFEARPITLYDQFGRPVYVPKMVRGDTITVRKPYRFKEARP